MKLGEVKRLSVASNFDETMRIIRVQRSDQSVCEVFVSAGNKVQLVATSVGTTELQIVYHPNDNSDQTPVKSQLYLIKVNELANAQVQRRMIASLNRAVERLAPEAEVAFTLSDQGVLATGECESEESARRILTLARRVTQTAVVDQLEVRTRPDTPGQKREPYTNYQPTMLRSDGFQDAGGPSSPLSILMQ